ncbi:MAG: amidohydrolase family protein [Synergistaceae bacterium]|jgi:predicted TIM-barrel fold metal-dependent hydrolase|nr:amidohydrolase family protein [Synergistaceae bacterium]
MDHIDFHIHLYPPEIVRDAEKISESEPYFDALTHNSVHKWGTIDDLLPRMERDGVERAVVGGFAFRDMGLCRFCNDYIIDCVKRYPEKLDGMCLVPPLARGFDGEILRCAEAGLIGAGEFFPEGQGIDIADASQTWRLAGVLQEANLCVQWHTAEPVGHSYAGKGSVGPREAALFCMHHPEVRVIFAHLGGGLWLYELMPEMKLYLSNAYYDLAALPWLYEPAILKSIEATGVADKFLMGTDFPILDSLRYKKAIEMSGISRETIEKINRANAISLLKDLRSNSGGHSPFSPGLAPLNPLIFP